MSIEDDSANPFSENIVAGAAQAARSTGVRFMNYADQGTPSQWIQGVDAAMAEKAKGLLLAGGGIGPDYFASEARSALDAGINIVSIVDRDLAQSAEPNESARVGQPYTEAARLDADWIMRATKCRADVLVITSNDVLAGSINSQAARNEFARYCGSNCRLHFANVPVAQWSTQIEPVVQSAIRSDPNINFIFPLYDSMSEYVVPGIELAGGLGRVHIVSFNGTPGILHMIQTGQTVVMDVGEDEAQLGYAGMDQMLRLLAGQTPVRSGDEHIPLRIFDKANVDDTGVPSTAGKGYGDAWRIGYLKLWGIDK